MSAGSVSHTRSGRSTILKDKPMKSHGCADARHGARTKEYIIWSNMKSRCLNKNRPDYKRYGGRGIKVCIRWLKFENFLKDMGKCPTEMTLDRKHNDKNYCKSNCHWATASSQALNRRTTTKLTYKETTMSRSQWAKHIGITKAGLAMRLDTLGWSVGRALTTPIKGGANCR